MRSHETKIEIDATLEAVWKALTDAEELTRWFCLDAKVEPGAGGSVWVSWGPGMEGTSRIEIWEPGRHLRTVIDDYRPGSCSGGAMEGVKAARVVVDYYLGSGGGKTVLRLVHSGFGFGHGWDDEYEGTKRGWPVFLKTLKHALERHAGVPCRQIMVAQPFQGSLEDAWDRLMGPSGFVVEKGRFRMDGVALSGRVDLVKAPMELAGVAESLNDSLCWLTLAKDHAVLMLITYGVDEQLLQTTQSQVTERFEKLLAG